MSLTWSSRFLHVRTDPIGMTIPHWTNDIAIDPDGSVWAFEGGAYFDGSHWLPIDGLGGLRCQLIGHIVDADGDEVAFYPKQARRMIISYSDNAVDSDPVGAAIAIGMPSELQPHQPDYREGAWAEYTAEELAWWVRLLRKRASHRTNEEKRKKDLYDADNYERMLGVRQQAENRVGFGNENGDVHAG